MAITYSAIKQPSVLDTFQNSNLGTECEIARNWMPENLTDEYQHLFGQWFGAAKQELLVPDQILNQIYISPCGVTSSQWVKPIWFRIIQKMLYINHRHLVI